jgi:hypothetical protein
MDQERGPKRRASANTDATGLGAEMNVKPIQLHSAMCGKRLIPSILAKP